MLLPRAPLGALALAAAPPLAVLLVVAARPAAADGAPPPGSASLAIPPGPPIHAEQGVPEQVIWLTSGAVVRGRIVEFVPHERVVLELATGGLRSIAWTDVARASWVAPQGGASASAATSMAPPPVVSSQSVPSPATAPSRGVMLHLLGDRDDLWLEHKPRFRELPWERLCGAPCGSVIDVGEQSLRVGGPGVRPSNPFYIEGRAGEETLHVRSGSLDAHAWGQRSLVTGIALAVLGGMAYGLGGVEDSDAAAVGGIAAMVAGGVGIVVALPLLGTSRTTVRNSDGERVGALPGAQPRW